MTPHMIKSVFCLFFPGMKMQNISCSKGLAFPCCSFLFTVFLHFFVLTSKIDSGKRCILESDSQWLKCIQNAFKFKNIKPCPKTESVKGKNAFRLDF